MLQEASNWLRTSLHGELTIEGHTDAKGTKAYNQALGYKRAQAVMKYLKDLGIKPENHGVNFIWGIRPYLLRSKINFVTI